LAKRAGTVALRERMEWVLAAIKDSAWGREEAKAYGALRARLESSGRPGNMDLRLPLMPLRRAAVLVTNDKALHRLMSCMLPVIGLPTSYSWCSPI